MDQFERARQLFLDAPTLQQKGDRAQAVGLPGLPTHSWDEHETLALERAGNNERLARIRTRLASNRTTHPLFDIDRFRRRIEAAYVTRGERAERCERPAGFAVPPAA